MKDATIWVVPVSSAIPNWKKLFFIFTPTVWVISLITFLLVAVTTYCLSLDEKKMSSFKSFLNVLMVTYSIVLNQTRGDIPDSTKMRIFLFIYSIFSMHWSTAYSTSLTSMMTSPSYDEKISSFDDILRNNLGFGMTLPTTRLFQKNDESLEDEV